MRARVDPVGQEALELATAPRRGCRAPRSARPSTARGTGSAARAARRCRAATPASARRRSGGAGGRRRASSGSILACYDTNTRRYTGKLPEHALDHRFFIADDHSRRPLAGFCACSTRSRGSSVVGEAGDGPRPALRLVARPQPERRSSSTSTCLARLEARDDPQGARLDASERPRVVVLTMQDDPVWAREAMQAARCRLRPQGSGGRGAPRRPCTLRPSGRDLPQSASSARSWPLRPPCRPARRTT